MGFFSPAPYHILSYGTLLGTTVFHTFLSAPLASHTLPRPHFSALMARLFPLYFTLQTALPAVLALTYPASKNPFGSPAGLAGVLNRANRWTVLAPLAGAFLCAVGNLAVVGPRTTRVMEERRGQEQKDGKNAYDKPPHSVEMAALNRRFSMLHGISSLLNLGSLVAAVAYGVTLSTRLT
ncbi:hypothetical protein C8A01DRAFT_13266 [Parachaetomium inaequale]|uniref:TMEM205-like domain-containing protein n=1 Tax=Parachaetomium inaequale TaxID=2588326 RepID=A0AAN6SUM3_9PEZI|nr:hypothetical protein C8A01DRAFT_13266 [Parachaetomium inaequale]